LTSSSEQVLKKITDFGYDVLQTDETTKIPDILLRQQPDVVVVDKPSISEWFLSHISEVLSKKTRIVAIGDMGENLSDNAPEYCDVVVDHDVRNGYSHSKIRYVEEAATLQLIGLQHFILRPQFYEIKTTDTVPETVGKILLMFGASDPSNYTTKALNQLLDADRQFDDINVVLGPGYQDLDVLESNLKPESKERESLTIERDVSDVAVRMLSADLVITSPGLTMIESLFLQTPVVAFYQNTLQQLFRDYEFVFPPEHMCQIIDNIDEILEISNEIFDKNYFDPHTGRKAVIKAISDTDRNTRELYTTLRDSY
jgi:Spore coat polysaccharide biosynthesis protein, predicted glycosyltransferase